MPPGARHRNNTGYAYLHNAIDDHSRLAYTEILPDERKHTAAAFWHRAAAWFGEREVSSADRGHQQEDCTGPSNTGLVGIPASMHTGRVFEALSMKPQRVVSLTDRVFEALENAIVRCELEPGEVVTDRALSERLDVSRTPVREALQRLAVSGLVVPRHRGTGWEIAGFDERDLAELFELRKALEPMGLRTLLEGDLESRTVHTLSRFFDDFDEPVGVDYYSEYFQRDHEFHKKIVSCTGNSRVIGFYGIVERQIDRGRHFLSTGYRGRIEENLAEHKRITRAIGQRDVEEAVAALLHHLQRGEDLMVEHIKAERAAGRF